MKKKFNEMKQLSLESKHNKKLFESFCLLTHPLKTHLNRTQLVHIFMHEIFWTKSGNEIRYKMNIYTHSCCNSLG